MATASSTPIACIEKQRLLHAFAQAVSEYNRMNTAQVAAVLRGEPLQFHEQIARAEERKDAAKYAILVHEQEHGC
jgi:hypothetical protein